ncbi:hypothetical protein F7725_012397 [Dissostichus mawsoni]|uniref:Uncharacterized protein n=1 Tax=Dissostichus mawsoni TaxID=36200 RepID=A0A7J5YML0_DISMA|nr:hypothetical protein F7725_012397 [Dissostichus mawsoni]
MGNTQSYVVSSLSVCCVYIVYVHIYSSYKSLKTHVLYEERLPSFLFLYIKYLTKAVAQRKGFLSKETTNQPEFYFLPLTVFPRLQTPLLRSFCGAAGYGWDYPDSDYRDVPLCFPEVLCRRLLLTLITDQHFRLSPAGSSPAVPDPRCRGGGGRLSVSRLPLVPGPPCGRASSLCCSWLQIDHRPESLDAFKEPLLLPGRVSTSFWEKTGNEGEFPPNVLAFNMQRHGGNTSHLTGFITR